jgi:hypothetical protein
VKIKKGDNNMARYTVGGVNAEAIVRAGAWDSSASQEIQSVVAQGSVVYYIGAADALAAPGFAAFNGSVVDASTLFTPVAGSQPTGDDGKKIKIIDLTGHAHTITTAANAIVNSKHIATFNGTIGSYVSLQAINGLWAVLESTGVTIS